MKQMIPAGLGLLGMLMFSTLSGFADNKTNPDQIGNRDVGKGVNFYSIDKEIAIGRQLAAEVERRQRSLTIASSPNTSTA